MKRLLAKYAEIYKISWSGGFVYRLNFIMWRVRAVIQLLTIYFLWIAVLHNQPGAFSYTGSELLTYVLGSALVRAVVFSNQSMTVQEEISSGDLSNYLVKPVNYFGYWFSRDLADKLLNIMFSIGEIALLITVFHPPLTLPPSPLYLLAFTVAVILAMIMYYFFNLIISMTVFWMPEGSGWPQRFFLMVIIEFLSGSLFPLDIFPPALAAFFSRLPTAYFIYYPMQVFLGRIPASELLINCGIMIGWAVLLWWGAKVLYRRGLHAYGAYGR